jgi:NADP-dependent aldehyde dehydrogenase
VTTVNTVDPRDGKRRETALTESTTADVDAVATRAAEASAALGAMGRPGRAAMLDAIAAALESRRTQLVAAAAAETGLASARLDGELTRAATQFRMFGDVLRDGGYLEVAIDHAAETPLGAGADVRRMLVPLGPVAVFGASNFPFAFSVAGGDTAAALAAGCPVIAKAHPSHPLTSHESAGAIAAGIRDAQGPEGALGIVYGQEAGLALVRHPAIRAAALTGSVGAARAIQAAIDERPDPIPLYGELSSVNPLVILPAAAADRTEQIAEGLFASFTGSGGQLCTKPGLAFLPLDPAGDRLLDILRRLVSEAGGAVMLNEHIRDAFAERAAELERAGARVLSRAAGVSGAGFTTTPALLEIDLSALTAELADECFGPLMIVVRYDKSNDLESALPVLPPSLTGTVHVADGDDQTLVRRLAESLATRSGRLVFNGYPTGVRVSWAQHHGGPWPSTNSLHTSVGATSIRRFLRPLAWQGAPDWVLPEELGDTYTSIPRRVDGVLEVAGPPREGPGA